jgi:hypothetical protein
MLALRARLIAALLLPAAALGACDSSLPNGPPGPPSFDKLVLDSAYRAEGVGVLDVNNDGIADIATDQYWYEGPSFTPHQIRMNPQVYDPATGYADCFAVYPQDVDGDGWTDIIVGPHIPNVMYWYKNPGRVAAPFWAQYTIAPQGVDGLETPIFEDLFGTGQRVLVMTDSSQGYLAWFAPQADPTQLWGMHPINGPNYPGAGVYTHGIGVGDVNRDGRLDVMTGYGWYEQTADQTVFIAHPFAFGPNPAACSRMWAYDFDGDGLNDILCSHPHDYGIHWWQQQAVAGADPTFIDHVIDSTISQMHALRMNDLDHDGVPEIISGKRFWAHTPPGDPGTNDPPVVTYYIIRSGPSFERHDVDQDSGVGDAFTVADVNGDLKPDIVTSNKKGLFVFTQQ